MITVTCQRTGCNETVDIGIEGDWSPAPRSVSEIALRDLPYGTLLYVYLPNGWQIDVVGANEVIHCPEHAEVS